MSESLLSRAFLLIVEEDTAVREFLELILRDAGYEVLVAASPSEARALLAAQPVDLLLVDLGVRRVDDPFGSARELHAQAGGRPVGLLAHWHGAEGDARRQGFAFLVPMPFDINDLLLRIAASLALPLSPAQQRQGRVVEQYFAALSAHDWDRLVDLCTETVVYVLPPPAPFAATVQGKAALRAYTEETYRHFPQVRFIDVRAYGMPDGIAARYHGWWRTPEGSEGRQEGAVVFTFVGDLIAQIGIHLDAKRLRALLANRSG